MNKKTNKIEKTNIITDFIGVYDNYILPEDCDRAIELYEQQNKFNNTLDRLTNENAFVSVKKDKQYFAAPKNIDVWWEELKPMIYNFDIAWQHYIKNTGALETYDHGPFNYTDLKIQKTLPTEGYHIWHVEYGRSPWNKSRAFAFTIYLNDVNKGGETEFLHFSKRVEPKKGRIVIWPAAFPYLHRGNPPLSGEKYILTSWMNIYSDSK